MASRPARPRSLTRAVASSAAAGSPRPRASMRGCRMSRPRSAGIVLFRQREGSIEVLLIKPGGPFWRNRHAGAWMIPKGMVEPGEGAAEAALREFEEETGTRLTAVPFPLATVRQAGGKMVEAFALEGD